MSSRPKRKVKIKSEIPLKCPRRWSDTEMEALFSCLMKYGHKNLDTIQKHLPGRSLDNIKTFIRTIYDTAGKMNKNDEVLDKWILLSDTLGGTPWRDCIQIAQALKYLSVDGLFENHPLPSRCEGIDFRQAYKLLYQAMMGYPVQPVNKETVDFVLESLAELNTEIKKQTGAIENVDLFLKSLREVKKESTTVVKPEISIQQTNNSANNSFKVYSKKKTSVSDPTAPSMKIIIKENPGESSITSGCSKDFSMTVEGNNSSQCTTTVNVPVACEKEINPDEEELLQSPSYNPFNIPGKWLEEPLYLNILQNV